MLIKKVSCGQFAGLVGREVEFKDGLNLIIGNNETGKSTIVDLIYHLFFQKASLKDNTDRAFIKKYFPNSTSKVQANYANGAICFDVDGTSYELSKEFGKPGSVELKVNGIGTKDPEQIGSILCDALKYGKGTFDELNFATQKREQTVLASLLGDTSSVNMGEISKGIKNALQESGNVDTDGLEKALQEKLSSMNKKWDFDHDTPEGGPNQKWNITSKDEQTILKAYYEKKDLLEEMDKADLLEKQEKQCLEDIHKIEEERERIKEQRTKLSDCKNALDNEDKLKQVTKECREIEDTLADWPEQIKKLNRATALETEYSFAEIKENYQKIQPEVVSRDKLQSEIEKGVDIAEEAINKAVVLSNKITDLESGLKGMKLSANIRQLGPTEVQIRSSVSGEIIQTENNKVDLTEATTITIPGVIEIELTPKGIDLSRIQEDLQSNKEALQDVLKKYGVSSAEELKDAQAKRNNQKKDLKAKNDLINSMLDKNTTWEKLTEDAKKIPDSTRPLDEIKKEMNGEIGAIKDEITAARTIISMYEKDYRTIDSLQTLEKEKKQMLANLQKKVESGLQVPEEFKNVEDPIAYDKKLEDRLNDLENSCMEKRKELQDARLKLENMQTYNDLKAACEKAETEFSRRKDEFHRWEHILNTFQEIKKAEQSNPTEDIEKYLKKYLSILSDGATQINGLDENLKGTIVSGNNKLSADTLSEGTKDTISLAFRLAMLKHLYPEGGCVAVFDDPFTDMDPKRTEQACNLLREFAKKNQVIFVSCDEKYKEKFKDKEPIEIR